MKNSDQPVLFGADGAGWWCHGTKLNMITKKILWNSILLSNVAALQDNQYSNPKVESTLQARLTDIIKGGHDLIV